MTTVILKNFDLEPAVLSLQRGDPVVFPTETVYGLGAVIFQEESVKKIFEIKQRPSDNPLIAHIASLDQLELIAEEISPLIYKLAEEFWPGPLAIVVKKRKEVPSIVSAGHETIAIRMPMHPVAQKLIEKTRSPLVAPSANLSGKPSPTNLRDVLEDLDGKVHFAIDGGDCEVGIESTVISLISKEPKLLRPGKITRESLEEALKQKVLSPSFYDPIISPGMKYRHYAPKAKVKLVFEKEHLKGDFFKPTAKNLYAHLREADRQNRSEIEIYCDQEALKDEALMNRLLRASGQMI
jgi:L-threonylcarbamoyladenylate synthase